MAFRFEYPETDEPTEALATNWAQGMALVEASAGVPASEADGSATLVGLVLNEEDATKIARD
jgi:hypothetical protein